MAHPLIAVVKKRERKKFEPVKQKSFIRWKWFLAVTATSARRMDN